MITFTPLKASDFSLLLRWLEQLHVKAWWDPEIHWTPEKIVQKYSSYVQGFKLEKGEAKKIQAYIISLQNEPIGYIQLYNAYDFERKVPLKDLPTSLGAFDMFIGEETALAKGTGTQALVLFLDTIGREKYEVVLADPDVLNKAAIQTYKKAGFRKLKDSIEIGEVRMILNLENNLGK